ncbi:MAG: hypothetical protein ACI4XL_06685 [Bacillus sp. (in: firmicutes)]
MKGLKALHQSIDELQEYLIYMLQEKAPPAQIIEEISEKNGLGRSVKK